MTSRKFEIARIAGLALIAASVSVGGCGKKKKPPPPPPPPPPPKVVIPDPVDANAVVQQLHADARVQFNKDAAPADRSLAEGAVKIADALARGDAAALKPLLDSGSQGVLDELVSTGGWKDGTKEIEQVRIVAVSGTQEAHPEASVIGTAIQSRDGAYLLAWAGRRNGESWLFSAAPCQADVKSRASEFDGVTIDAGSPTVGSAPEEHSSHASTAPEKKAPGFTAPERDPNRKSTPAGPITIPSPKAPGDG